MTPEATVVSYRSAADRIGRSVRQIQRLVKAKRLDVQGVGQRRKVTVASIENLLAQERERNRDNSRDILLSESPVSGYQRRVIKIFKSLPPLSPPRSVSRRLGIPSSQVEAMVENGSIPSLKIGRESFIPRHWLAAVLAKADGDWAEER